MQSLSKESECDDAVKCGSARGKAAMLRSLLRKDGTSFIRVRQMWAKRLTGLRQTEVIIL